MSGLAIIRQLLIFDNVLFVRIILPFASPLDPSNAHLSLGSQIRNKIMQTQSDSDQREC